jgi:chromate transporter
MRSEGDVPEDRPVGILEIFFAFRKLGLTAFGGPVAHIGYFRREFVEKRKWLGDHAYGDIVALCQFLPGPASSQVGMSLGLMRGGWSGAVAAWAGFTLPSALAMTLFAFTLTKWGFSDSAGWLHGLKVATVAVVAQAVWLRGKALCPDMPRAMIALAAAVALIGVTGAWGQVLVIAVGGVIGWKFLNPSTVPPHVSMRVPIRKRTGILLLTFFALLLVGLPVAALSTKDPVLQMANGFYRAGSLVFGGGHVVLPLLQSWLEPAGWVTNGEFLAGYGAAQAVPGPLFTFAAYLGALSHQGPGSWSGAALALFFIFLPCFLLVAGALPIWEGLRRHPSMSRAMAGVNAAVVGVLLAAFYDPVWTSAISSLADFGLAAACLLLLAFWRAPSWSVVIFASFAAGIGWR